MTKKLIFRISIAVNIILAIVFVFTLPKAVESLNFEYVEQDTIRPDTLRAYLERENYGTVAALSRAIRGGAEIDPRDEDYYRLGEYGELLFLKEVYDRAGNLETLKEAEDWMENIRNRMPEYDAVFDKIDQSAANAVRK